MRSFTKIAGMLLAILLLVVLLFIGSIVFIPGDPGTNDTVNFINVNVTAGVRVTDMINDTPVIGVLVHFVACSPNGTSYRDVHMEGLTGDDGMALFSTNYSLDKGGVIYLGASNRKPLVEADFSGRNFNGTGYLGVWKSFDYNMLYDSEDQDATLGCIITVDRDSGKMI